MRRCGRLELCAMQARATPLTSSTFAVNPRITPLELCPKGLASLRVRLCDLKPVNHQEINWNDCSMTIK